jgi:hypothetical protein
MGKAAELREKLEHEVQEFMAGVKDDDLIEVGPGSYFGNSLRLLGGRGAAWKSGPNSSQPQACQQTHTFTATNGTPTFHSICPGSSFGISYQIVVR